MRPRHLVPKATPVASSNYKRVLAARESLAASHEERLRIIRTIEFSKKAEMAAENGEFHIGKPYIILWPHSIKICLFIFRDEVERAKSAGFKIHYKI